MDCNWYRFCDSFDRRKSIMAANNVPAKVADAGLLARAGVAAE
jgi:hypothetical protein